MDKTTESAQVGPLPLAKFTHLMFRPRGTLLFFIGLFIVVSARVILLLPSELEFRNFAFRDLGSFQHVDRLIAQGLHPGIDFGFTYGLLGVLLQHGYFAVFGAGYGPTLGLLALYVLAMVILWSLICREIGQSVANLTILLGLSGLMIYIAPFPPTPAHVLLELSLATSLYLLLKRRLPLALLAAVLGTLAIPSIPIVLSGLLTLIIAWNWWLSPERTLRGLLSAFAPALGGYAIAVAGMSAFFGWQTVLPTLLPLSGARHYRAMNFGFFKAGRNFWGPPDAHFTHYLFTPAGIWLVCSGLLAVFGCVAAWEIARTHRLEGRSAFILVCCALHIVFIFLAFGNSLSYVYYSFFLSAGILAGVSGLRNPRLALGLSLFLLVFGLLSQSKGWSEQLHAWRSESRSTATASLYAPNDFQPEWQKVLWLSNNRRVVLLAYGTGVDLFAPKFETPQSWMLLPGLLRPREDAYVLRQIQAADAVVVHLEGASMYIDRNKDWETALGDYPVRISGRYFRIYARKAVPEPEMLASIDVR